jgi:hypothetical protein
LRTVYLRPKANTYDDEGNTQKGWGDPVAVKLNVQPASGQLNASLYGERLRYMKALKYQGDALVENRDEGAGFCVDVDKEDDPDYVIVSINTYATHKNLLIERLEAGRDGSGA